MYIKVQALPSSLQTALSSLCFARADIEVTASETYSLFAAGGDGYRAFVVVVNLATGESQITRGSWGGGNIHNPQNSVDRDDTARPLPANFAVISGREGGDRPVHASIKVNPATLAPLVTAPTIELSDMEQRVLAWHKSLNSAGRKDAAERFAADRAYGYGKQSDQPRVPQAQTLDEIDAAKVSLAEKGLLKIAKNGAASITTEGKNMVKREWMYL
jgi:hypothetical protein